ncbi:MAG: tetratricopeptide repeat protein [Microcoleaceae cyanobacterium]
MVETKKSIKEYLKLGNDLLIERKYEEAEQVYRQAIELESDHPWINCNLGRSLLYQGKVEVAIPYLQKAIELDGNIAEAYYNLGNAFTKQNRFEEAVNAYRQAIELEPNQFLYYHQLGDSFLLQGKYEEAISPYHKAIELNSEYAWSHHNLGRALSELGRWEEAIAVFHKAVEIDSNLPGVHEKLGEALMQDRLGKEASQSQNNSIEEDESLLQLEKDLIKKHPLPHKNHLPTDKIPLAKRVEGLKRVIDIYENKWRSVYQHQLLELKEKYKKYDRAFILGENCNLEKLDLKFLQQEITFGTNNLFLKLQEKQFNPTFYVISEQSIAEKRQVEINQIENSTKLFPLCLSYCMDEKEDTIFLNHALSNSYPEFREFSTDASSCLYADQGSMNTSLQLAYYFGFKKIYLIGFEDSSDVYLKAREICEVNKVNIYDATIDGKSTIFPKAEYHSLFNTSYTYPRILIIDMTRMGGISATGQIKKTLFAQWPKEELLQVYSRNKQAFGLFSEGGFVPLENEFSDEDEVLKECIRFNPDLIYYRPVANKPYLHDFTCEAIKQLGVPVVTHIMDDWPDRLSYQNPPLYQQLEPSLRILLSQSVARLSICDAMSQAFESRYGLNFIPIANCVEPTEWLEQSSLINKKESNSQHFLIRYIGGLAEDMNFASILDIANAVEALREEFPIKFEIYTMAHYKQQAIEAFAQLSSVSIHDSNLSPEKYRQLLSTANALIVAYNFDEHSIRYVRYSMANKLPECMASGTPVLVYGPMSVATVAYASAVNAVQSVTERDPEKLRSAIRTFANNPTVGTELAQKARQFAFENHSAEKVRGQFLRILQQAAGIT